MAEILIARVVVSFNGFGKILLSISSNTVAIAVLTSLSILSVLNNFHAKSLFWPAVVRICSDIRRHDKTEAEIESIERRKESDDGVEIQCVICLCEVCEGEVYTLLPKCNHGFHVTCIEAWLQTHSTCPLCRCPVTYASVKIAADHEQEQYLMDTILSHLHRFLNHLCTWFVNPLGFDQQFDSTFTEDYRSVL